MDVWTCICWWVGRARVFFVHAETIDWRGGKAPLPSPAKQHNEYISHAVANDNRGLDKENDRPLLPFCCCRTMNVARDATKDPQTLFRARKKYTPLSQFIHPRFHHLQSPATPSAYTARHTKPSDNAPLPLIIYFLEQKSFLIEPHVKSTQYRLK